MTTIFNRIPKMILAITALTFGTAGVAIASPGHASVAKYAKSEALVAQAGPAKMHRKAQRKANKRANRTASKQARQAKRSARIDSNGNGTIEASERQAVRQQRFATIDANRDGAISLREMEMAKAAKRSKRLANLTPEQQSKRANRAANLTPEQQANRAARKAKRQAKRPSVAKGFSKLDANSDGSVSRGEFIKRPGKAKRRGKRAKRQRS